MLTEVDAEHKRRLRQAELAATRAAVQAQEERKRRRWAVAFVLVLLAGIIGTSVGLLRSQQKEREAQKEKAAALASQQQAMEPLRPRPMMWWSN